MHNKLLVADNQAAILGGRNIGDDYFGRSSVRNFVDLDLLLSGGAVPVLSQGFDSCWNSRWSYPVNQLLNISLLPDDLRALRKRIDERLAEREDLAPLLLAHDGAATFQRLKSGALIREWRVLVDDPDVGWFEKPDDLADELTDIAFTARREVLIVSPYLVPGQKLLTLAQELSDAGIRIAAITNSLQTNDVVVAQAAYSDRRDRILDAGVELYEFRGAAKVPEKDGAEHISLHPKYMLFDESNVFLGSLNLDPRSLYLNTELGVYLDSPELAEQLRRHFAALIHPDNAWRVRRQGADTVWESSAGIERKPPARSRWQRFRQTLLKFLPLSGQV